MSTITPPLALRLSAVLCAALVSAGCSDKVVERKFPAMPEELADCRVFYVQNSDGHSVTVVRCPHSATTANVPSGKTTQVTVAIDGGEVTK